MKPSRHLTPNLYITHNDVEIIDCLADNRAMFKNFAQSQITSFMNREDFYLVLFLIEEQKQGFTMYVVEDFSVQVDDMFLLSAALQQWLEAGHQPNLFMAAKSRVDDMIHMAPTFRAVFGKKNPDEFQD